MDLNSDSVCAGCGQFQGGDIVLSHAHIVSRNRCKQIGKPELIYNPDNIVYLCMDFMEQKGCHNIWDGAPMTEKMKLHNFRAMVEFISVNDPQRFGTILQVVETIDPDLHKQIVS